MTEEVTPKKKPRRKRRTKAEIAAAEELVKDAPPIEEVVNTDELLDSMVEEKEIEINFGSSYEAEVDAIIEEEPEVTAEPESWPVVVEDEVVKEEPVASAPPPVSEEPHRNRSRFGLGKVKARMEAARNRTRSSQ